MASNKDKGDDTASQGSGVVLKRQVGLISGIALIVGSMVGSGIFVSPKGILREAGSVGMSLIIWVLCAFLSMIGALCYSELGTLIPKSGGEYAYLKEAFGPLGVLGELPAFLFAWTYTLIIKPSIVSIISLIFGTYVVEPFFGDCAEEYTSVPIKLFAALSILIIAAINLYSVKGASFVQNFFTAAKLLALVIIILVGFVQLIKGQTEHLEPANSFEGSATNIFKYSIAFYQGLWAYESWNQLNFVTEELQKPSKNLPLAILIAVPLVAVCYILVNIAYFTTLSPQELLSSGAVGVDFAERTLGPMAWIIPFFVCCSTFGAANGTLFASGRIPYVAAREGHLPQVLSFIHVNRLTPFVSLLITTIIALLMLIPGDFDTLVNYFSFATWISYGGTVTGLLVLRVTHPEWERPFKVPIILPIIFLIASLYLLIAPIINEPAVEFIFALLFILAGLLFYFPFIYFGVKVTCMDSVTLFLQKFFKVAPSTSKVA